MEKKINTFAALHRKQVLNRVICMKSNKILHLILNGYLIYEPCEHQFQELTPHSTINYLK